jgi:hypothetical protein
VFHRAVIFLKFLKEMPPSPNHQRGRTLP